MTRHNPFRTCPLCGAHLDPGERCDCQDEKEEAPPNVRSTGKGKGGTDQHSHSASNSITI